MPYKDREAQRAFWRRTYRRRRHGNWRQVYVDCDGMCQFPVNGGVCGAVDDLEFHEQFGENGDGRMQQRILYCNSHHDEVHNDVTINERHYPTMLQADVGAEIEDAGGYRAWLDKFGLKEKVPA